VKEGDLLSKYREFCTHVIGVHAYKVLRRKDLFRFLADFLKIPQVKNGIVYSNQYHDCVMGYALARSRNIPLVCHLRTPAPKAIDSSDWQLAMSLKGIDQFIAVSNQTKSGWVELGFAPDKIEVVHNGSNLERFQPPESFSELRRKWNIPEDTKVIGYVGRLDKVKGVETLIKAFALLEQSGINNAKLLIAGRPVVQRGERDYKQFLEQLPSQLGIEKSVEFLGHLADTVPLYQVSDLTVLPSLYSEPFGRTVIESMACGTPVVGSNTGGIPEILTGEFQRGLFEPGNEQDLANAISKILNWRSTDPRLGERCRIHASSGFSLKKAIDSIESVLLKAASSVK
jgi:glycosyltransferase involved in cell wall biosynthesis